MRQKWRLKKKHGFQLGRPVPPGPRVSARKPKDTAYLDWVRAQPCALRKHPLPQMTRCKGIVEAHHNTHGKGQRQRTDDRRAFPLCPRHHREEFHAHAGTFDGWKRAERNEWQDKMSETYRAAYEASR